MSDHTIVVIWLSGSLRLYLYSSALGSLTCCSPRGHKESDTTEWLNWTLCSCHLLLISYVVHRSIPFASFFVPIFAQWLVSLIFLKRSLVFPILLFSSISLHCWLRKAFSMLLALFGTLHSGWVHLSFSPLPSASLFSATCKASSDSHFAFLHFCSWGWFWLPPRVQCYKPPSIVLHALSQIPWIYLLLPL